jgi:ATPase subunit of ABC transporter with duplicated ATPase domains
MERKRRTRRAEASLARQVSTRRARVDRARAELDAQRVRRTPGGAVGFAHGPVGGRWVAELDADVVRAGDVPVLRDVHVGVGAGDRIHVTGANGAGKTTLLRAVLDAARLADEAVAALPQELGAAEVGALLDETRALDPDARGRVLGIVARLGVEPDRLLASADPSPGEARKLALAHALGREVALVALDEPTNHLDLPAIERLEAALVDFPGAVLLVTHDDQLADATTSTVWEVAEGRVAVRRG